MNNMLGDCYAAAVIEKISKKDLEGLAEEDDQKPEEEIPMNVV